MLEFHLFTKANCPLCTEALLLLHSLPLEQPIELRVVDIASEPELQAEYGWLVPVLYRALDDEELRWPFTAAEAEEFVQS